MGYDVIYSMARPSSAGGAQDDVGLGVAIPAQRGRGKIESTRFHGPNVLSCEIADYRDDGETGGGCGVGISAGGGSTISIGGLPPHL